MEIENKDLLIKDLYSRFPYKVICEISDGKTTITEELKFGGLKRVLDGTLSVKPFLRPMSSMTEEEKIKYQQLKNQLVCQVNTFNNSNSWKQTYEVDLDENSIDIVDWLNAHHFDYRGLIEKGLALEANEEMYKNE